MDGLGFLGWKIRKPKVCGDNNKLEKTEKNYAKENEIKKMLRRKWEECEWSDSDGDGDVWCGGD